MAQLKRMQPTGRQYTEKQLHTQNALSRISDDVWNEEQIQLRNTTHEHITSNILSEEIARQMNWELWTDEEWEKVYEYLLSINEIAAFEPSK